MNDKQTRRAENLALGAFLSLAVGCAAVLILAAVPVLIMLWRVALEMPL